MILGIIEELGELTHAHLKLRSNIRNNEDHKANIKDAIGDIFIFLMAYTTSRNLDLQDIIESTWNTVKQRNWRRYPIDGKGPDKDSSQTKDS